MPSWDDPEDVFNTFSLVTEVRITSQHLHWCCRFHSSDEEVAETACAIVRALPHDHSGMREDCAGHSGQGAQQ
jgi:hypothetical protein